MREVASRRSCGVLVPGPAEPGAVDGRGGVSAPGGTYNDPRDLEIDNDWDDELEPPLLDPNPIRLARLAGER